MTDVTPQNPSTPTTPRGILALGNRAIGRLTTVDGRLKQLEGKRDAELQKVRDRYAPRIDPLTALRTELVDQIKDLFEEHREVFLPGKGKTAYLPNGTISAAYGPEAIVIDHEPAAMRYTRLHRMLNKVTKRGKRTFVKASLKRFREFVNKNPFMHFEQPERMTIHLARTDVDIEQDLTPLRRDLDN